MAETPGPVEPDQGGAAEPQADYIPEPELDDELFTDAAAAGIALGESDQGKAANDAIRSLARAARSFLMYDPGNEAIKIFLKRMHGDFQRYFHAHGVLPLGVRPFEMVVGREVVYLERDRERSLAFKLYRDGVRNLVIRPEVEWDELLSLLKILSIRYVGIRSNEDDIVTLLWKAGFSSIDIHAVEGFVPKDEDEEDEPDWDDLDFNYEDMPMGAAGQGGPAGDFEDGEPGGAHDPGDGGVLDRSGQAAQAIADEQGKQQPGAAKKKGRKTDVVTAHALRYSSNAPPHFDLPSPVYHFTAEPSYLPLTPEDLGLLHHEIGSAYLPDHCLELVDELIDIVLDPVDRAEVDEILPLLGEIRDFLLTEGQLENLLLLIGLISALVDELGEAGKGAAHLLESMVERTSLVRLVKSLPRDTKEAPPQFNELLECVPGDHLPVLLDLLDEVTTPHGRQVCRLLLETHCEGSTDRIAERLLARSGTVAADMLRILGSVNIEHAWQIIDQVGDVADGLLKNECLYILEKSSYNNTVRGLTFRFLGDPDEDIRIRSIEVLLSHNDRRDFPMLRRHADQMASKRGLSRREAQALGEGMARLDAASAMRAFREWIVRKGMRKLVDMRRRDLQWAAASGLALVDEQKADELLHSLAKVEEVDLRRHALRMRMVRYNRLKGNA